MQFSTIFTIISAVAVASAIPTAPSGPTTVSMEQCGAKNVSCCNTETTTDGGLLGLGQVLGGSCTSLNLISLVNAQEAGCKSGNTYCCDTDEQTGLINVGNVCSQIL